ncbi:Rid family detoxifying hydrolase [Azospira restricta]|uniref:Deaminase n=1 Tax=Azospira restricta TaxID=404405 RepID=A0A974PX31_9RHOO|nr:Rid family detoxifying hydrolase [Azospira restricta]QRJ62748.1 deaminase [Azospira restricta]
MEFVATKDAPAAIGPYSQAVASDGWLFTSGQIPLTAAGEKVDGDIARQTGQVLDNLEAILASRGLGLSAVVSTTVYLTDLAEFAAMNAVYATRFGSQLPARTTVQVAALPTGARVEISAVARLAR